MEYSWAKSVRKEINLAMGLSELMSFGSTLNINLQIIFPMICRIQVLVEVSTNKQNKDLTLLSAPIILDTFY